MTMIEQSWFNVTTWALRDWEAAQSRYWDGWHQHRYDPHRLEQLQRQVMADRSWYRQRVLSWYWKLCVPMQPGECVPNEVAALLAEDWDLSTSGKEMPGGAC